MGPMARKLFHYRPHLIFQVLISPPSIFLNIMYNRDTWRKCHVTEMSVGLLDDYFPDYQLDCASIILLNDCLAQESGESRFFCCLKCVL